MFVRVLIPVDGPYAPTPISGSVACELLEPEKVVGLSLVRKCGRACAGCPAGAPPQASSGVRSQPYLRFRWLIRPSEPVCYLTSRGTPRMFGVPAADETCLCGG